MQAPADIQGELFGRPAASPARPAGLGYWPDVITVREEADLAAEMADLPFKPFEFHGYLGNRRTVSFGFRYDYGKQAVEEVAAPPAFLRQLRERVAQLAGALADTFAQVLVNEYAPGAGIGWHRDRPQFGLVAGVSLLSHPARDAPLLDHLPHAGGSPTGCFLCQWGLTGLEHERAALGAPPRERWARWWRIRSPL